MTIYAYQGISRREIQAVRTTSEGKPYSLDHPKTLVVNMRYAAESRSSANSQGWERSSSYYFKELQKRHPEYFSKKNIWRIEQGESPRVDAQFVKHFPQYKGYENQTLIHHHVGKDGQAVAIPQSMHKGSGEIHTYENQLGITDNAQKFSSQCKADCQKNPQLIGQSADQFKERHKMENRQTAVRSENAFTAIKTDLDFRSVSRQNKNAVTSASKGAKPHKTADPFRSLSRTE